MQIRCSYIILHLHRAGVQDGATGFVAWLVSASVSYVLAIAQELGLSVELHAALGVYSRPTKLGLSNYPAAQAHEG